MDAQKKKIVGFAVIGAAILLGVFLLTKVSGPSDVPPGQNKESFIRSRGKVDLSMYAPSVENIPSPDKFDRSSGDYALSARDIFSEEKPDTTDIAAEFEQYIASDDIPHIEYDPSSGTVKRRTSARTGTSLPSPEKVSRPPEATDPRSVPASASSVLSPDEKSAPYARLIAALDKEKESENGTVSRPDTEVHRGMQSVSAVVHREQSIAYNGRVKMRTIEAGKIDGIDIPANTYIFGISNINQNRVFVTVVNAVINGRDVYFKASVYDASDGAEGIFVAGLDLQSDVNNEVSNEASDVLRQGGAGGRIAGGIVQSVTRSRNQRITLSNNHKIFIR